MAKTPLDSDFGPRIRARRKSIGMTQADLAAAIGVSFQQVQKYEKGLCAIPPTRLQWICDALHLPAEYFTGHPGTLIGKASGKDDEADGGAAAVERFIASGEGRRLIESFLRITDPALRTRILDFIAAVAHDRKA